MHTSVVAKVRAILPGSEWEEKNPNLGLVLKKGKNRRLQHYKNEKELSNDRGNHYIKSKINNLKPGNDRNPMGSFLV